MDDLTQSDKRKYLKANGQYCPFCKSVYISGSAVNIDGDSAIQDVKCTDCNKTWCDIYKLADIQED